MRVPLLLLLSLVSQAEGGIVNGAGDADIRYTRAGTGGTPIVSVHGWTCDSRYQRHQAVHFAIEHTVVTVDLAGHGESGSSRDDRSMAAFGEDVAAVVYAEDLNDIILVGHSMGGAVVIEAARRLGERVRLVVAVDTLQEPTRAPYSEEASRALWAPFARNFSAGTEEFVRNSFFLPTAPRDVVDWVARDMASADAGIALAAGHALTTWDAGDGIRGIANVPLSLSMRTIGPPTPKGSHRFTRMRV